MLTELLKQFKFFLEFDNNDVDKDQKLKDILVYVNGLIRNYYGFNILDVEVTELRDGTGINTFYSREGDIREITSLVIAGAVIDLVPETTLVKFSKNRILSPTVFTTGVMNIDLVYRSGYVNAAKVPTDLLLAMFTLGRKVYYDADLNRDNFTRIASDTKQAVGVVDSLPLTTKMALDARKVWALA